MAAPAGNLVSTQYLDDNLKEDNICILYTCMANPASGLHDEVPDGYIPGSVFFDFEDIFSDQDSELPHTMPTPEAFTREARKLGVNRESTLVVYDNKGIYCAPRVWWMFKAMGFEKVLVLDGGLPKWRNEKRPMQRSLTKSTVEGTFCANYDSSYFINAEQIMERIDDIKLLDARSCGRFQGVEAEPRAGLRSGHIPGAQNLPFTACLREGQFKSISELQSLFCSLELDPKQNLVFSCGSGVTACILALAAAQLGYENLAVYDGSWSEWGAKMDLPVEL